MYVYKTKITNLICKATYFDKDDKSKLLMTSYYGKKLYPSLRINNYKINKLKRSP